LPSPLTQIPVLWLLKIPPATVAFAGGEVMLSQPARLTIINTRPSNKTNPSFFFTFLPPVAGKLTEVRLFRFQYSCGPME
jgi:hypothetical protein